MTMQFYAFVVLASDGDDLSNLARLLARRVDGIHAAPFEQSEIGPNLSRHACLMGLERLVSKHRDYGAGRFDRWVKVKHRKHAAYSRVMDKFESEVS